MTKTTVTIIGAVRRAAALIETTAVQLSRKQDDTLEGAATVDPRNEILDVTVHVVGQAGTSFTVRIAYGAATVEKKSRLVKDGAVRVYAVPLRDFKE